MTESSQQGKKNFLLSRRAPTLADVARQADVSHQTVSRVVNGHPSVAPTTRRRVQAAIAQLRYQPNSAARYLATNRSRTLGVISFDQASFGLSQILVHLDRAAQAAGYVLLLTSIPDVDRAAIAEALGRLASHRVDGIVAIAPFALDARARRQLRPGVPLVVTSFELAGSPVAAVGIDQETGTALATEHLLRLGHRVVGHLAGPSHWTAADQRRQGWAAALAAAGLPPGPLVTGDWSAASGYVATQQLLAEHPALTALVVANDHMAIGALRALHEAGRRVPADVSVVGFDDVPEVGFLVPPLTTIRNDFRELATRCVSRLLEELGRPGQPPAAPETITPSLVVRSSTAPPPARPRGVSGERKNPSLLTG